MGRKRRQVGIQDASRWIFNRMASVYPARPAYPRALVEAIVGSCAGDRVLDLGAGTGHLSLPLAERGLRVTAVDAAAAMLEVLRAAATSQALAIDAIHARAEELPFARASFDLVLIADALHFLDVELTAAEVRRVLAPRGALAIVTCDFSDTPYMAAVRAAMQQAAPRRPRTVAQAIPHLASLSRVELREVSEYRDDHALDPDTLEGILRSVSFIGPAMNAQRFEAFRAAIRAIPEAALWSRTFRLHLGRRSRAE